MSGMLNARSPTIASRKHKPPLPPRYRWPRGKQPPDARKACTCGRLDRAVSSRRQITYYGPAVCPCGRVRGLRKVERPIDWDALRTRYAIPRDFVFQ